MRHAGLVVALLTAATHLPACAVGGSPREPRGESGPVSWKIVDIQQELEAHGSQMRWTFSIVLTNGSDTGICAPTDLHRIFTDGVIVYYTLVGRDDRGGGVRVPIAIRLNRSVGERQ